VGHLIVAKTDHQWALKIPVHALATPVRLGRAKQASPN
jgi:hypothetical protein